MSKPREFWINIYDKTHRVYDCVAHETLERCNHEVFKKEVKEQAVHVVEHKALDSANAMIDELETALKYYSFTENHEQQFIYDKDLRKDVFGSAVSLCDNHGRKAREALEKLGKYRAVK